MTKKTRRKFGYRPHSEQATEFDKLPDCIVLVGPPAFATDWKEKETGKFVVGHGPIIEVLEGAAELVGQTVPFFLWDPAYDWTGYGRLVTLLGRFGLSPAEIDIADEDNVVRDVNLLMEHGHPARVVIAGGNVKDNMVRLDGDANKVLMVFDTFGLYDFEKGRFAIQPSEGSYGGQKKMQYQAPILFRILSPPEWRDTMVNHRYLHMALHVEEVTDEEDGSTFLAITPTVSKGSGITTNWGRLMSACGIVAEDIINEAVTAYYAHEDDGEEVDVHLLDNYATIADAMEEAFEDEEFGKRPHILGLLGASGQAQALDGRVLIGIIHLEKGYLQGNETSVATRQDLRKHKLSLDDVKPLITLADVRGGKAAVFAAPAHAAAEPDSEIEAAIAIDMYNAWSQATFEIDVYGLHANGKPKLNGKAATDHMVKYVLPLLEWQDGKIGVVRRNPCAMTGKQREVLAAILAHGEFMTAVDAKDSAKMDWIANLAYA